ncbi:hypothetical protein TNCV_5044861 [Trichonephila clavipes]|uniref:Uncharacterized protein n=1 Tax=Trichonephila clavipes TaxID=2585209 RepID=A0A8X6WJT9_TRICX|nr:hypothetical protein TNCV_5044861 [Trichonephila clavipes]
MSYDYTACKRSLECLFGLGALDKIKNPSTGSHRQELRCLPLGVKITYSNWYLLYDATLKSDTSFWGMSKSAKVKIPIRNPIRKKKYYLLIMKDFRRIKIEVRDLTNVSASFRRFSVAAVTEWSSYQIVASLVTSSSPVPPAQTTQYQTRREGERCTLNLLRTQTSSH